MSDDKESGGNQEPAKIGGKRPGAGRPKGSVNKRTIAAKEKIERSGLTPLEFMLRTMKAPYPRNATPAQRLAHDAMRHQAARDAAPYVHARLSSVQVSGGLKLNHEQALDELE